MTTPTSIQTQSIQTQIDLPEDWSASLRTLFQTPEMTQLKKHLLDQRQSGVQIFPKNSDIFRAFHTTPFRSVKVVILGQDPYHGPGQAHGLSFSVPAGTPLPPSLQNIFKELRSDLELPMNGMNQTTLSRRGPNPRDLNGDLSSWAMQGVLLLNATLTVQAHKAGSHQNLGWERFTDGVIQRLAEYKNNIVFILWGAFAQKKKSLIQAASKEKNKEHLIIETPHPSPLSSYRGFFGSKPFSKTNHYLKKNGQQTIQWESVFKKSIE